MKYFGLYLCFINILAFILFFLDKRYAVKGKWRISENSLMGVCILGGCIGALCGIRIFRHKTKHKKFTMGVPAIFILQCALVILYIAITDF